MKDVGRRSQAELYCLAKIDDVSGGRGHPAVALRPRVSRAMVTDSEYGKTGERRRKAVKPDTVEAREDESVRNRRERRRRRRDDAQRGSTAVYSRRRRGAWPSTG